MFPKPGVDLAPMTVAYETTPLVKPTGFREYDARWLFGPEINLMGMQALGLGLGTYLAELGASARVVVGHDFRSYSLSIKQALMLGLVERRLRGARHRPGGDADGLFRPVRPRRALRGHGHRQPQ